jgi:hypothetical protein
METNPRIYRNTKKIWKFHFVAFVGYKLVHIFKYPIFIQSFASLILSRNFKEFFLFFDILDFKTFNFLSGQGDEEKKMFFTLLANI